MGLDPQATDEHDEHGETLRIRPGEWPSSGGD